MILLKVIFLILLLIYIIFYYECPFKLIFGIPCPACGFRSAIFSCLEFKFKQAFNYHPLFWLLGIDLLYLLFCKHIKVSKKIEIAMGIGTIVLLLVVWIYRVWYHAY